TSSHALNHATLPFGLALAAQGERAMVTNPHLRHGLNIHRGRVTCAPVARALNLPAISAEEALGMG
ncbi:MAG TPA: alanine dehydrogenase, partial [Albitalea sp.]